MKNLAAKVGALLDWEQWEEYVYESPSRIAGQKSFVVEVNGICNGRRVAVASANSVSDVALFDSGRPAVAWAYEQASYKLHRAVLAYSAWRHRMLSPQALALHAEDIAAIAAPGEFGEAHRKAFAERLRHDASPADLEAEVKELRAKLSIARSHLAMVGQAVGSID